MRYFEFLHIFYSRSMYLLLRSSSLSYCFICIKQYYTWPYGFYLLWTHLFCIFFSSNFKSRLHFYGQLHLAIGMVLKLNDTADSSSLCCVSQTTLPSSVFPHSPGSEVTLDGNYVGAGIPRDDSEPNAALVGRLDLLLRPPFLRPSIKSLWNHIFDAKKRWKYHCKGLYTMEDF